MLDIWGYIAVDNRQAADNVFDSIRSACEILKTFPEAGIERSEIEHGLRSLTVGNYLVFYSVLKSAIRITRVVHGARYLPDMRNG